MIIRELEVGDVTPAREVMLRTVYEDFGDEYDPRVHADIDDMVSWYLTPAGPFMLVAVDEETGEIVGTAGIRGGALKEGLSPPHLVERYRDGRTGQLVRVYVLREHRRRGIARQLVLAVLDRARRERHYDTIALHTYPHSPGALPFWQSFGATVVEDDTAGVSKALFMEFVPEEAPDMTRPVSTSRSTQSEGFATAPQGNVTQASHKYVTKQNLSSPNATNTFNSGEAEQCAHDADVAVIGLGSVGSMAAWRLAARGQTVHGYERFGVGHDRGAFSGQTRRFSVQSQREPRWTPLALAALDLWRELESATGRSLLTMTGGLILGPADAPALVTARRSAVDSGLAHDYLDAAALAARFPQHLVRPTDAGVVDPMAGFVRPEAAVVGATRQAMSLGATVFDHTRVLGVEADTGGVVVRTAAGSRRYGTVVVAPGARARDLLALARTTVLPRRVVQAWYLPHHADRYHAEVFPVFERVGDVNAYGFPTVDGATVKIGVYTSGHPVVYDTDNAPAPVGSGLLSHFRDTIATYFPDLHPEPVTTTVNLEGYTTDGQPLVGTAPGSGKIIVACGFSGMGFKFAPVIGDALADLATTGHTKHDIDFLAPDRPLATWPPEVLVPA